MRVGVTYNLRPPDPSQGTTDGDRYLEWDDEDTVSAVCDSLAACCEVVRFEVNEGVFERLRRERPDIVFNIAEGLDGPGREALIPAYLDYLGIPYTGSDPCTLAICLNKARAKEVLLAHGLPTPAFQVIESPMERCRLTRFPLIVKPVHEGSSKGIRSSSIVYDPYELAGRVVEIVKEYDQPALVEEFLPGREFTAALIGNGPDVEVLPLVEICLEALPEGLPRLYGYEAKWVVDNPTEPLEIFRCPAPVSGEMAGRLAALARKTFRALGCRDWARIDIRLDAEGNPNVLEVNPLPGILPDPDQHSCFPEAARAVGMTYEQMIRRVLETACRRLDLIHETIDSSIAL